MAAKIILTSECGSAKFSDRVLLLGQEEVRVSRSSTEEKSDTYNAVFDCRVLSKFQAAFSYSDVKFYLKDTESCNGTFINNFRLSKESEKTQIYSQDIIRFGSQVEMGKTNSETAKCIVARIRIYLNDGTEFEERAANDKFFRSKADILAQEKTKQEGSIEDKVDQLEKMITDKFGKEQDMLRETIVNLEKRLKRKQNENQNLLENIAKISEDELNRVAEIYYLKEAFQCKNKECEKLADELAVKVKEQIEKVKVKDLQSDLQELRNSLTCKTEEIGLLEEKLRIKEETSNKKDKQISKLSISLSDIENYKRNISEEEAEENVTHIQMKTMLKDCWTTLESQKVEIKQLTNLVTKGDQILEEKEMEITELTNLVEKDKEEMKIKDGQYVNLKSLVDEENETVEQVRTEMTRLLNIITENQEVILKKDQVIDELKDSIQDKDELVKKLNEKELNESAEYFNLKEEISKVGSENATNEDILNIKIESLNKIILEREEEIKGMKVSLEKQEEIFKTYESLKDKIKQSMLIVEQKSKELEKIQNGVKNQTDIDSRIYELEKENSELKVKICQKESDIVNLKELIENKDIISAENCMQIEQYIEEVKDVKTKKELENDIIEKEKIISQLKGKIENNRTENDSAKYDLDYSKKENNKNLESKAAEIDILKSEIMKEKQKVFNVQFTQGYEIMGKEREISILNTILTQERKILLEKEEEIEELRKYQIKENEVLVDSPPFRPPRTKSLVTIANIQEQAKPPTQPEYNDDKSDTVTFHDALNNDLSVALSDEEDVLIEDLELDEETDDRQHRRSDINFAEFSYEK